MITLWKGEYDAYSTEYYRYTYMGKHQASQQRHQGLCLLQMTHRRQLQTQSARKKGRCLLRMFLGQLTHHGWGWGWGDNSKKACFGRSTNFFRQSGDFAGNRRLGIFFWEIWHRSGILQKKKKFDIFARTSPKNSGGSFKFPGGLKITHSVAQPPCPRVSPRAHQHVDVFCMHQALFSVLQANCFCLFVILVPIALFASLSRRGIGTRNEGLWRHGIFEFFDWLLDKQRNTKRKWKYSSVFVGAKLWTPVFSKGGQTAYRNITTTYMKTEVPDSRTGKSFVSRALRFSCQGPAG